MTRNELLDEMLKAVEQLRSDMSLRDEPAVPSTRMELNTALDVVEKEAARRAAAKAISKLYDLK